MTIARDLARRLPRLRVRAWPRGPERLTLPWRSAHADVSCDRSLVPRRARCVRVPARFVPPHRAEAPHAHRP
jgi:hypothetical protein